MSNNKIKAVIRISTRRAKFREKPFAVRLHERSAKAAFELWTESESQYTPTETPPLSGARYTK